MILPLDSALKPVVDGKRFDRINADKEWQRDEIAVCKDDPWYWIVNYCWTIYRDDDGNSHVKRVPPKEYLRLIANDWYIHKLYALSKSRQLLATWLMSILHSHECMFKENVFVACQAKKEEEANEEMIQRADFVHSNLPGWMKRACPANYTYCNLRYPRTKSRMLALPEGGDKIRSRNPNRLLSDEIAFQNDAEKSYTAALACCHRITLVSSANPGFFRDLVKDKIRPGL